MNPPQAPDIPGWSFAWRSRYQSRSLSADERGFSICGNQVISGSKRSEIMTHPDKQTVLAHPGPGKITTTTKAAVASGDKDHNVQLVSTEAIRLRAYRKWESAGKPNGDGMQFWPEAEQELVHGK
jgi:signal recognition particle GTPase